MRIIDLTDDRLTLHGSQAGRGMAKWGGVIMRQKADFHSPQTGKGPKGGKRGGGPKGGRPKK